ncbi:MAG TPA: 3,4-dihydroxy-2-butanone-4-phosphate synthase [Candidatus Nanopelagicaceae bacterium]
MTLTKALAALQAGDLILVTDDPGRENEGDLILAAQFATEAKIGFMVRHTSGIICVALTPQATDLFDLPPMVLRNEDLKETAFTVTVDKRFGTTTGISPAERAATIVALSDPLSIPNTFTRPGHVFPLRSHPMGLAGRQGHTEAAIDLMRLAGLHPAGVLSEVVGDSGEILKGEKLKEFANSYGILTISISEIIAEMSKLPLMERDIHPLASALLPRDRNKWTIHIYRGSQGESHIAMILGELNSDVLTRIHSECRTGDVFGSARCDCGAQLHEAMSRIESAGSGLIIYLDGHEGRGIGLVNKIKAYSLQDQGFDTVEANLELGLPVDARKWEDAIGILKNLNISKVRLMSHNPLKLSALLEAGIEVRIESTKTHLTEENRNYLTTKQVELGHNLVI